MEFTQPNHEDIQQLRLKQIADFNQAAASIAMSSGDATPFFRATSLEVARRPDILKPPIEIEFILNNGAKIIDARMDYLEANNRAIEKLKGMSAILGRRMSRIERIETELIDREGVAAGSHAFRDPETGKSLVPDGQSWRFSFQNGEWVWERFITDAKEPFVVTRFKPINNMQNIQAIEYHVDFPDAMTETYDKNQLRRLGIWTYAAANATRDMVYLHPESRGTHLPLTKG